MAFSWVCWKEEHAGHIHHCYGMTRQTDSSKVAHVTLIMFTKNRDWVSDLCTPEARACNLQPTMYVLIPTDEESKLVPSSVRKRGEEYLAEQRTVLSDNDAEVPRGI